MELATGPVQSLTGSPGLRDDPAGHHSTGDAMELWLSTDEMYPVYSLSEKQGYGTVRVELTADEYQDYLRAEQDWEAWQEKLGKWPVKRNGVEG